MGFLSRTFVPRSVRRAAHPVRTAKRSVRRAVVPKPVRSASYWASQAKHPVKSLWYHQVERPVTTALRSGARRTGPAPVYRHAGCDIKHRSPETRAKCRHGSVSAALTAPHAGVPNQARSSHPEQGAPAARSSRSHPGLWLTASILLALTAVVGPSTDDGSGGMGITILTIIVCLLGAWYCWRRFVRSLRGASSSGRDSTSTSVVSPGEHRPSI